MKSRVLLIEDNVELAENLREIIEFDNDNVEVAISHTGDEGLARLTEEHFNLVLTDMKMPGLNGSDVVREMRRLYPDLPAVVMTAYAEDKLLKAAKDWGAVDVLIKPVGAIDLLSTVSRFVASNTRILIVEDDRQLRTLLSNYLSRFDGVQVTQASDLASALHLAHNVRFDAAILDVNLPDGTTISRHRSLAKDLGEIPLIYITGNRDGALEALPTGLQPPPIISKPFRPNELKQALDEVLN